MGPACGLKRLFTSRSSQLMQHDLIEDLESRGEVRKGPKVCFLVSREDKVERRSCGLVLRGFTGYCFGSKVWPRVRHQSIFDERYIAIDFEDSKVHSPP